ncbi:hypothetical protein OROGR_008279 [Orobanche gracilis]
MKMAPETESNWLSFSLSSMEMLNPSPPPPSSQPLDSNHYYSFADNFYATGWPNQKSQAIKNHDIKEQTSSIFTSYSIQQAPKLEDFFAGDSTETQSSSLTKMYDHHQTCGGAAYFGSGEQQDIKTIIGFPSFSAKSVSDVDDSPFVGQTRSPVESATELVTYSQCAITTTAAAAASNNGLSLGNNITTNDDNINNKQAIVSADSESCKKIDDTFGQRTSIYRGVTSDIDGQEDMKRIYGITAVEGRAKQEKGVKLYLGGYDKEEKAANAYDLAALKYWGPTATTNFPIANYTKEVEEMKHATRQEFIASLRRKSSGFSRGASIYRGVTRHHQQGRWQARIGRVAGNKDLYLGTFATEEEAAEAYDIAAIKFRGINAVTNFEMSRYDVEAIANSPLPIGGTAKRLKLSLEAEERKMPPESTTLQTPANCGVSISFAAAIVQPRPSATIPCGVPLDNPAPFYHQNLFHHIYNTAASSPINLQPSTGEFFVWPHQS